ncbi:MAG: glutathione peroxidase [Parvularcula sp.]|jgi:glutathione peroxidase|nr:glutathione peroxidase [Parvularcula sp.]
MIRRLFLATLATTLAAGAFAGSPPKRDTGKRAGDFSFESIDGGPLDLAQFRGRPVIVVNTASRCGYVGQYDGLQALWSRYRDRGLVVIGVPSDDFGGQELDSEAAVKDFCETNFSIDFPMTAITKVRGPAAHPFYLWAAGALGGAKAPRWNFHKYLVDGDGALVAAFGTGVEPDGPRIRDAVERLLPAG